MKIVHNIQKHELPEATYIKLNERKRKEKRRSKAIQRMVSSAVVLLCVAFLVLGGINLVSANSSAYVLMVGDNEIATLASMGEAEAAIDQFIDRKSAEYGMDVVYTDDLQIEKVSATGVLFSSSVEAGEALDGNLHIMAKAVAICIDGEKVLYVADEDSAREAIDMTKEYFVNSETDELISVSVEEQISVVSTLADIDEVLSSVEAMNMLLYGEPEEKYYFVENEGETFAEIAERNSISVDTLKQINSSIADTQSLSLGTAVSLSKLDPMINILLEKQVTQQQVLEYSTIRKDNYSLDRGEEKVVSTGVDGLEEVVLKIVVKNGEVINSEEVSATTLVEPVDEVIERGTKIVLASRDSSGSGVVGWPYIGTITSRFGWRSRGWHSGLDIAGPTGDPIVAAEAGTVTFAEWYSGYGNLIKIDHGNGMETYYAHLSEIYVSVGDEVERGEYIGDLGSTGNSTGPHLHFEVRFDGTAYNPLDYLD